MATWSNLDRTEGSAGTTIAIGTPTGLLLTLTYAAEQTIGAVGVFTNNTRNTTTISNLSRNTSTFTNTTKN